VYCLWPRFLRKKASGFFLPCPVFLLGVKYSNRTACHDQTSKCFRLSQSERVVFLEVTMVKPLNEFGGWLRFFSVACWFGLLLWCTAIFVLIIGILGDSAVSGKIDFLISVVDGIIYIVLISKILRILKTRDSMIPKKIIDYMGWILIFTFIFEFCHIGFYYYTLGYEASGNVAESGKVIVKMLFWYATWTAYLRKSKRVLAYYCKNVD